MRAASGSAGRKSTAILAATLAACAATPAPATEIPEPMPVAIRGRQPTRAEVIALCPDVGLRPEVFLLRGDGGLGGRLARAGYLVYLVDPWATAAARDRGLDAVAGEVYPALVERLRERTGVDELTWIGHGSCGLLPVLAAARGGAPPSRWVALGSRFDQRFGADAPRAWLSAWQADAPPPAEVVAAAWLTGAGGRGDDGAAEEALAARLDAALVSPPPAVVDDLLRWDAAGAIDGDGADPLAGLAVMPARSLLVAGASDPWAPPEDVLPALARLDAEHARYRLLSRVNGDREEYGHAGLLLSPSSARDVDRLLLAWLRERRRLP